MNPKPLAVGDRVRVSGFIMDPQGRARFVIKAKVEIEQKLGDDACVVRLYGISYQIHRCNVVSVFVPKKKIDAVYQI